MYLEEHHAVVALVGEVERPEEVTILVDRLHLDVHVALEAEVAGECEGLVAIRLAPVARRVSPRALRAAHAHAREGDEDVLLRDDQLEARPVRDELS